MQIESGTHQMKTNIEYNKKLYNTNQEIQNANGYYKCKW